MKQAPSQVKSLMTMQKELKDRKWFTKISPESLKKFNCPLHSRGRLNSTLPAVEKMSSFGEIMVNKRSRAFQFENFNNNEFFFL